MIRILTERPYSCVTFPYDPDVIAIVKQIPGRQWDKQNRCWWISTYDVDALVQLLTRAGHIVAVDGKVYGVSGPGRNGPGGSPLAVLFAILPARLRRPTYLALSKVLHPDAGGDTELMKH